MKCSVYIAATVDGFIASEDGGMDCTPSENGFVQERYEVLPAANG